MDRIYDALSDCKLYLDHCESNHDKHLIPDMGLVVFYTHTFINALEALTAIDRELHRPNPSLDHIRNIMRVLEAQEHE